MCLSITIRPPTLDFKSVWSSNWIRSDLIHMTRCCHFFSSVSIYKSTIGTWFTIFPHLYLSHSHIYLVLQRSDIKWILTFIFNLNNRLVARDHSRSIGTFPLTLFDHYCLLIFFFVVLNWSAISMIMIIPSQFISIYEAHSAGWWNVVLWWLVVCSDRLIRLILNPIYIIYKILIQTHVHKVKSKFGSLPSIFWSFFI